MNTDKKIVSAENAAYRLVSLYRQHGFLPFKMTRFEEYELYVRHKEFLVSDNVITFNDTDGRLLALKPDVTLSIVKNATCEPGCKQRVYYSENVYRVSHKTHNFKEFMQVGLEAIGDVDVLDIYDAVYLGAKSLSLFDREFFIDLSHLGILSKILSAASADARFVKEATKLVSEKNMHGLSSLCAEYGVEGDAAERVVALGNMYGDSESTLMRLRPICEAVGALSEYEELSVLCSLIAKTDVKDRVKIDFSVVNDMNYYNGIVFVGFLNGISEGVLSGGEYGKLVKKMGKAAGAVGFAIYLDLFEDLLMPSEYDVDALILYSEKTDPAELISLKNKLISEGRSVSAQRALPKKIRYKEIIKL